MWVENKHQIIDSPKITLYITIKLKYIEIFYENCRSETWNTYGNFMVSEMSNCVGMPDDGFTTHIYLLCIINSNYYCLLSLPMVVVRSFV